jgi:hypothetical protein
MRLAASCVSALRSWASAHGRAARSRASWAELPCHRLPVSGTADWVRTPRPTWLRSPGKCRVIAAQPTRRSSPAADSFAQAGHRAHPPRHAARAHRAGQAAGRHAPGQDLRVLDASPQAYPAPRARTHCCCRRKKGDHGPGRRGLGCADGPNAEVAVVPPGVAPVRAGHQSLQQEPAEPATSQASAAIRQAGPARRGLSFAVAQQLSSVQRA